MRDKLLERKDKNIMDSAADEFYFCLRLTENEHYFAEDAIKKRCEESGLTLKYYRKLKEGHIPLYREIKITGAKVDVNYFKRWFTTPTKENNNFPYSLFQVKNPYKTSSYNINIK